VLLVWLYAAIRPRFGPGPATAAKAGVAAWFVGSLLVTLFSGRRKMMPQNLTIITTLASLVSGRWLR